MCCLLSDNTLPEYVKTWLDTISYDLHQTDMLPLLVSKYIHQACEILSRISKTLQDGTKRVSNQDVLNIMSQVCGLDNEYTLGDKLVGEGLNLQFWTAYRMAVIKLHHFVILLVNYVDDNGSLSADSVSNLRAQRVTSLRKIRSAGQDILNTAQNLFHATGVVSNTSASPAALGGGCQDHSPVCWADAHRLIPAISLVAALPSMAPKQRHEAETVLDIIGARFRIRQAMVRKHHAPHLPVHAKWRDDKVSDIVV